MRLIVFIFLLFTLNIQAQDAPIGIKGGMNVSNISGKDSDMFSSSIGFQAGLFTEIPLAKQLKLQPELLFTVFGYDQEDRDFSKVKLNYIVIPLMAKFYFGEDFSLDVGPQVGLLILAKNGSDYDANVKRAFKDKDLGLNFGMSFKFSKVVGLSLRYYLGMTDITSNESFKNKNRAFQVALEFKLN